MVTFFRYIFSGILFMFAGEFLVNVSFKGTLSGFFGTIVLYIILLTFGYGIISFFRKRIVSKWKLLLFITVLFGTLGLFGMEWAIIGNTPWGNPDANQISMFIWWAGVFVMPLLWNETSPTLVLLRKRSIRYHIFLSGGILSLALLSFFVPIMKFIALYFYTYGLYLYSYFMGAFIWKSKEKNNSSLVI